MKFTKNRFHSLLNSPLLFFFSMFLLALIFTIGCKDKNKSPLESVEDNGLNNNLVRHGKYLPSSIPVSLLNRLQLAQNTRGQVYWYNIFPSDTGIQDIHGAGASNDPQQEQVTVLDIVFNPLKNGIYNTGNLGANPKDNWGGLFTNILNDVSNTLSSKNIVMKLWINIVDSPSDAILNIDLGQISEDIIPNRKLDSEDRNNNDLVDLGEDVGIDNLPDTDEPNYNALTNPDPNNDDYTFRSGVSAYENINGLEGNSVSLDLGRTPSSEDLNRNFKLDLDNNYNCYQIPLNKDKLAQTKIIQYGSGTSGWIQVKIPIDLPDVKVGAFNKLKPETLRLWITNAEKQVHIRIADIKFEEL